MKIKDNLYLFTGGLAPPSYRITVMGECCVYVEGVKRIIDIKEDEIILNLGDKNFRFVGKGLKISAYVCGDVKIDGDAILIEKIN